EGSLVTCRCSARDGHGHNRLLTRTRPVAPANGAIAHPRRFPLSEERPVTLRVFGCLPVIGQRGCTEAGVRKASREETAGGVRTDADVDLWGICRRCLI